MDAKDRSIAWQNATNAAATALAGIFAATGSFDEDLFNNTRANIFEGSVQEIEKFWANDAAGLVQQAFPGAVQVAPAPLATVTPIRTPAAQLAQAVATHPSSGGPAPFPGVADQGSQDEAAWQDLFANYGGWFDNRADKASGKSNAKGPDFKRKSDKKALWIKSKGTPQWVLDQLGVPST